MSSLEADVKATIRNIPDFPKPGILFKDIAPVLQDASLLHQVTDAFAEIARASDAQVIVGMESRGFLFGVPLAMQLGLPFVPARKPGKLPYETVGFEYELEYGTNRLEMHIDAIAPDQRVLIVDDLLATGGTARATCKLAETLKGQVVACCFVIELDFLKGRDVLTPVPVHSLVHY